MTLEEHKAHIQHAIAAAELDGFDVFRHWDGPTLLIAPAGEDDETKFVVVIP